MWTWLASFLGGPIVNGLINAYKAKLEAANTQGAQAADLAAKAIAAEIEARMDAQAIIIAEQGRWWTALPRALVQWSFAVFVVKCVVWDLDGTLWDGILTENGSVRLHPVVGKKKLAQQHSLVLRHR